MYVAQLLYPLLFAVNVEVIIPRLPERALVSANRHGEFERLHRAGQGVTARLAHQQVHMLGHDDITRDNEVIAADALQCRLEKLTACCGIEVRKPPITTESEETEVTLLLVSNESVRHLRLGYIDPCWFVLSQV